MQSILVINSGSSTIKFAIFSFTDNAVHKEFKGVVDRILTKPIFTAESCKGKEKFVEEIKVFGEPETYYKQTVTFILDWVLKRGFNVVAAGHRVVHGGQQYFQPVIVDQAVLRDLAKLSPMMPLHQPFNIKGIETLQELLPKALEVACFDTGFHVTCDPVSQTYAVAKKYRDAGVRRYGFHGLSYEYLASQLPSLMPASEAQGKFIAAHLGNGSTMCAIAQQKSVATSIGMTAVGGLPMGTRCDSLDPGALIFMMEQFNLTTKDLLHVIYKESGLLGVSGISSDMRDLLASDSEEAKLAIAIYTQRIAFFAGALSSDLRGCDGFIFAGGIGENAYDIRKDVIARLAWLGFELDEKLNSARIHTPTKISSRKSKPIFVIPTDEEVVIAKHTMEKMVKDRKVL